MSLCKKCGKEIEWMVNEDGRTVPVDPEPVFVIENGGNERFYTGEETVLTGRAAKEGEIVTKEQKLDAKIGFAPHWRTCRGPYN